MKTKLKPQPKNRLKLKRLKRNISCIKKETLSSVKAKRDYILNIRQGSKISRVFRHLFNQKRVKTIVGGNLALLALISSVYSPSVSALNSITQTDNAILSPSVIELTTTVTRRIPLDNLEITQGYAFFHSGIDFNGVTGDPVYPMMKGKVEAVITDRFDYGKHIIVDHGSGLKSLYAHLSKFDVKVGEEVDTNQVIGQVGATGRSFGDHLHFEVYQDGRTINPKLVLPL